MGTRAAVITYVGGKRKFSNRKTWGGFPEEFGKQLCQMLTVIKCSKSFPKRAEHVYLRELDELCAVREDVDSEHADVSYLYRVDLDRRIRVRIWTKSPTEDYETTMGKRPLFEGDPTRVAQNLMGLL